MTVNLTPNFIRRRRNKEQLGNGTAVPDSTVDSHQRQRSKVIAHRLFYVIAYLIALIFIILVTIGSTSNKPVLRNTFFLKIDLSNIIPTSVPNAVLINSIARTIGLHDFYQVGLWNFCEGFNDEGGITFCSKPKTLYYFDPIKILMSELLAGATIALPGGITDALDIARKVSYWMFGLFLTSACLIFLCMILTPFSVPNSASKISSNPKHRYVSKWIFLPLLLLTFLTFVFTLVASGIATAMFTVFVYVFKNNGTDLNIRADLGVRMLVFMWIAVACTAVGFAAHMKSLCAVCCCCCCRRHKRKKSEKNGDMG